MAKISDSSWFKIPSLEALSGGETKSGSSRLSLKMVSARTMKSFRGKQGSGGSLPPVIDTTARVSHVLRFAFNTAVTKTITPQMIAGACGGVCTVVNSTFVFWASAIRVKRVTIWPSLVGSTSNSADVAWSTDGTNFAKDEFKIATLPIGVTNDKPVSSVPPTGTTAKFWQASTSTASLFAVTAPAASVIDVSVEYTLSNALLSGTLGIATGALGTVYYLALDGPGSNTIRALGVPTTA
jgi:hypothetical protein